ncbi:hypothetical protein ACFLXY_01510 [Chloroflexota bacterium]
MQLTGKNYSRNPQTSSKQAYFFLDECLPYKIGDFLHGLGYPIVSWFFEFNGQQGIKDIPLIHYLGGKGYSWITKDDAAKYEHEPEIRAAGISVVWIRGLEREKGKPKKNKVSAKDVHRMLTDKIESVAYEIEHSKTALYFLLSFKSGSKGDLIPIARKITLDYFFKKHLPKLP